MQILCYSYRECMLKYVLKSVCCVLVKYLQCVQCVVKNYVDKAENTNNCPLNFKKM